MGTDPIGPRRVWKGSGDWTHWFGTPTDLATFADLAVVLVSQGGAQVSLQLDLTAQALDATLVTPDQIRDELTVDDLVDASLVKLEIREVGDSPAVAPRRVSVEIAPPPPPVKQTIGAPSTLAPVVKLRVTGPDRKWVDLATAQLTANLNEGKRIARRANNALLAALVGFLLSAIVVWAVFDDDKAGVNAGEVASLVFLGLMGVAFLVLLSLPMIAPQLEFASGREMSRWGSVKRRLSLGGRWLGLQALGVVIAFLLGAVLVYLWKVK